MTRRTIVTFAAGTAAIGLLVGLALALVLPGTHAATASGTRQPRLAPARPPSLQDRLNGVRVRQLSPARIEARTPDPLGGPDWAVRVVEQQLLARRPDGRVLPSSGPQRCGELGRLVDGQFGWIDGANVFRPVPVGVEGAPLRCAADPASDPQLELLTRVAHPADENARGLQSIAWGLTGPNTRATIRINATAHVPPATDDGAFVVAVPFTSVRPGVQLTVTAPARPTVVVESSYRADAQQRRADQPQRPPWARGAQPLASLPLANARAVIEYRTPDPGGGLAWGLLAARAENGGWCTSDLGRVVDGRVGELDATLGTMLDVGPDPNLGCLPHLLQPTPRQPIRTVYGSFTVGPDAAGEQVARRAQTSRTFVEGIADPRVRSVTLTTPDDVRTILPSNRAHAFLVIYDGDFPTGAIVLTARFADGHTITMPGFNANTP